MKSHPFLAAVLVAFAGTAGAQTLKPGLWEVHNKMSGGQMDQAMADMQKQMAGMPPEQRKMMEEMMARQGVKMGQGGPGGMSAKVCMTKEMVEKNELPTQQGDCRTTQQSRSGNTLKFAVACTHPPSTGEGQVIFHSPEAYSMKMAMNTQVQGRPEKTQMDGGGKWLGADCGNVKPMGVPPAKK
ncbi:MAG TPA: DUF3617 domain-containing protein [Ramlibacter sp.]|nr:DUF3617 domain-containing protein [Ramlibacter sp.]